MPTDADQTIDADAARLNQIEAGAAVDSPDPDPRALGPGDLVRHAEPSPDQPAEPAEPAALERITAGDKTRAAIAARFKQARGNGLDFHGDYRDATQQYGAYGAPAIEGRDTADRPEPGIPAPRDDVPGDQQSQARVVEAPEPSPAAAPHGLEKVVVHGTEMWLTPEQMRAEAQKSLAAGNILETAKEIKEAVSRSTRPHRDGQDPQRRATPGERTDPDQNDPYERLVHELQFGDPEMARRTLRDAIASDARAAAQVAVTEERFGSERSHRIRALAEFQAANADLATDPYAPTVITSEVNRQYVADLKALGIPDDQMPRAAAEIADWHMQARVQGKPVRDIAQIFDASKARFLQWRGGTNQNRAPAGEVRPADQQSRPTAPRVELSPDRTQRRAAVPTQPQRAGVPQRDMPQAQPGGDRSSAVMAMRRARGQVVG